MSAGRAAGAGGASGVYQITVLQMQCNSSSCRDGT